MARGASTREVLAGKRILLTRPPERARRLMRRLAELGAIVRARSAIDFVAPADPTLARQTAQHADDYDWIVFTSANGVRFFHAQWLSVRETQDAPRARLATVGPATSRAAEAAGFSVARCAEQADAEGLAAELQGAVEPGQRVLVVRPEVASDVLPRSLGACGARVDAVAYYRTVPSSSAAALARSVVSGEFDAIVFTSPSSLTSLLEAGGIPQRRLRTSLANTVRIAIGARTAAALRDASLAPSAVAQRPDEEALVEAIVGSLHE